MTKHTKQTTLVTVKSQPLTYQDPFRFYRDSPITGVSFSGSRMPLDASFLLESRSPHLQYARSSIVACNSALRVEGKNDIFSISVSNPVGETLLGAFREEDFPYARDLSISSSQITGKIAREKTRDLDFVQKLQSPNTGNVLRTVNNVISRLHPDIANNPHFGLYGAFASDFAYNFIEIENRNLESSAPDFLFYLPTTVAHFDDIRQAASIHHLSVHDSFLVEKSLAKREIPAFNPTSTTSFTEDMSFDQYGQNVETIIKEIQKGRLMQVVPSRSETHPLRIHPIESYSKLRDINPSPYSFYFDFGDQQLYGASPELHIKTFGRTIEIRPIAGTARRSPNPLTDSEAANELRNDAKELAEHSMLVDLAKSELCDLCDLGSVDITDVYTIESNATLHHIVSGIQGKLQPKYDDIHAILGTIPAGTLSGAPKSEAMKLIDQLDASGREFYGGAVGYLAFNGDCNTGITIRSVHVKDAKSTLRSGAGIVLDSKPEKEIEEIKLKMKNIREVLT